jgi:hypothetical protein
MKFKIVYLVAVCRSQRLRNVERDVEMISSNEKPRILKKAVVVTCEVLSRISSGRSKENHGKAQSHGATRRDWSLTPSEHKFTRGQLDDS